MCIRDRYCLSFECTRHIAFVLFFFQSLALVVLLLTLYKSYDYPVSYTHLDVYKRQVYTSTAFLNLGYKLTGSYMIGMCSIEFHIVQSLSLIHISSRKNNTSKGKLEDCTSNVRFVALSLISDSSRNDIVASKRLPLACTAILKMILFIFMVFK